MNCKICQKQAVTEKFCQIHLKACENIVRFPVWRKALKMSWREYLREIEQNPLTGVWTKEVANYLINNEGTGHGEES